MEKVNDKEHNKGTGLKCAGRFKTPFSAFCECYYISC